MSGVTDIDIDIVWSPDGTIIINKNSMDYDGKYLLKVI
jgi:hypothetical protein